MNLIECFLKGKSKEDGRQGMNKAMSLLSGADTGSVCARCVMDTSDPDINFDEQGVCNHCHEGERRLRQVWAIASKPETGLYVVVDRIKQAGKGKEFDSVLGLSGGVDSSYVAYLAGQLGLRPLVVHFDNGWNSDIAVSNIKNIVEALGADLVTYVIDWEEFRDLQRAFFKASVVDIEALTDHAIKAATIKIAKEHQVKHVLVGGNVATEHGMPKSWKWRKQDLMNIKSIHRRYGDKRLKTFPTLPTWRWMLIRRFGMGYENVRLLDLVHYRKLEAKNMLKQAFNWRDYGGKHYESVFTKFYQAYILPEKFGIDKRKVHLSALIRNGEISRVDALNELRKPPYEPRELEIEKEYVLKKLGFTQEEFDRLMREPIRTHDEFATDERIMRPLLAAGSVVRRLVPRRKEPKRKVTDPSVSEEH